MVVSRPTSSLHLKLREKSALEIKYVVHHILGGVKAVGMDEKARDRTLTYDASRIGYPLT